MKAEIKKEVFARFHPKFMVGLLVCSELDNQSHAKDVDHLLEEVAGLIKLSFNPIKLKTHDLITVWEVAVEGFSGKKHYCSAVETLIKKVLESKRLEKENTLRDLCNFISLKHLVPVDGFDLGLIEGDLNWDVNKKDLVLSSGAFKLSEKLALKKNKKFDISKGTKKAIIVIEAIPPVTEEKMKKIMDDTADLAEAFCGGKVKKFLLNAEKSEANF